MGLTDTIIKKDETCIFKYYFIYSARFCQQENMADMYFVACDYIFCKDNKEKTFGK